MFPLVLMLMLTLTLTHLRSVSLVSFKYILSLDSSSHSRPTRPTGTHTAPLLCPAHAPPTPRRVAKPLETLEAEECGCVNGKTSMCDWKLEEVTDDGRVHTTGFIPPFPGCGIRVVAMVTCYATVKWHGKTINEGNGLCLCFCKTREWE